MTIRDAEAAIDAARASLVEARDRLNAEIRDYPRPISGCDAQFNFLLGERERVARALSALGAEIFVPTSRHPDGVSDRGARAEPRAL